MSENAYLVFVSAYNGAGIWARHRRRIERRSPGRASALGKHTFSRRDLERLVVRSGFAIEAWGRSNFLSAVWPFSVSRYRRETFGWLERWDVLLVELLPLEFASGWYLSLHPAGAPPAPRRGRPPLAAAVR